MATIRREQLAAVNINYRMYPFQDFLDTQRELEDHRALGGSAPLPDGLPAAPGLRRPPGGD